MRDTSAGASEQAKDAQTGAGILARKPLWKAIALLVGLILFLALVYFSPLRKYLSQARRVSEQIRAVGVMAPVVFTLGVALLVAVGMPRLLFCPISGMAFGFLGGLLWSQVGTLLGYYLTFLFIRWVRRYFVFHGRPRMRRLADLVRHQGIPAVILARQLPIHGTVTSVMLSLSPLRHRDFLIGTAVGLIPEAIPCTLIGSGAVQSSFHKSAVQMVVAVVILVVVWAGFGFYARRLSRGERGRSARGSAP